MKIFRVSAMLILLVLFLAACGGEDIETNMSEKVQAFEFTTQDNKKLSLEDLKGEWWVADTIFTSCTTVCPPMTANMAKLQAKLEEKDLDAQLVSFSTDPETDTPEKLKEFAEQFQADFSNWTFLTGYDFETIKEFSVKSFRSLVQEVPDSDQVMHGTSFFLVNPDGEVVKRYNGMEAEEMDLIAEDLEKVL